MAGQVDTSVLLMGFGQAYYRFMHEDMEFGTPGEDPQAARAFLPLFETLNWAVALCDRLDAVWPEQLPPRTFWHDGMGLGATMRGVRFARNRFDHQWADAIRRGEARRHPRQADTTTPVRLADGSVVRVPPKIIRGDPLTSRGYVWVWRRELPPGRPDPEGERAYAEELADFAVRQTLNDLVALFAEARSRAAL